MTLELGGVVDELEIEDELGDELEDELEETLELDKELELVELDEELEVDEVDEDEDEDDDDDDDDVLVEETVGAGPQTESVQATPAFAGATYVWVASEPPCLGTKHPSKPWLWYIEKALLPPQVPAPPLYRYQSLSTPLAELDFVKLTMRHQFRCRSWNMYSPESVARLESHFHSRKSSQCYYQFPNGLQRRNPDARNKLNS
ncbi:MAG: hypothetical protein LQ342_002604 [Letrouitia transgressa]|nr:MAG: hypothetical protein LQ342_002604 [Letrouitia transgressa]